jgi:hypothetical protein
MYDSTHFPPEPSNMGEVVAAIDHLTRVIIDLQAEIGRAA